MLALGAGVTVHAQADSGCVPPPPAMFQSISRVEIESLLKDVAASNPKVLDKFREDPEMKQAQIDNLRELLAFASAAVKEGLAAKPDNCHELEYTRDELIAVQYDKEKNKGKVGPPFGLITDASAAAYWNGSAAKPLSSRLREDREAAFKRFLETKLSILAADSPALKDKRISEAEAEQARKFYAKTRIYAEEYKARSAMLPAAFKDKVQLQVKLQQAQFLARQYSGTIAAKTAATPEEIAAYILNRPELDPDAKRSKAEGILRRAISGEDFAKLADEFSDDPGTTNKGGLYANVRPGQMIEAFEKAALSLEPGKVNAELTKTDYGYHIIKLEKKGFGGMTYDVRHILISTGIKDPDDPTAREMPVNEYVRSKIEEEKTRRLTEQIVAENAISVPDDFEVPVAVKTTPARSTKPRVKGTTRKRK